MAMRIRIPSAISTAFRADETLTSATGWSLNLAIFRIVFLVFGAMPLALDFLSWAHTILPGVAPGMWVPISFYRLLPINFLGNVVLGRVLAETDIVLIVFGIVGYQTRLSIALATLISSYGFGLPGNLGHMDHQHHVIWFMALLAAGPSGRRLSLDSLILAKRNAGRGQIDSSSGSVAALWTLRYTWLLMGLLYLGPGIAKLQSSLTDGWANPENLRMIMWKRWLQLYWYGPHSVRLVRADLLPAWILAVLGAGVIAFEIGFIFAVLSRKLRPCLALWGIAFHVSNTFVFRIWFGTLVAAYVALIDWAALWRFVSQHARPLLLLYDKGFGHCRRMIAFVTTFELFGPLEPATVFSSQPVRKRGPEVRDEMLNRGLYSASAGRHAAGYAADAWTAKKLAPFWRITAIPDAMQQAAKCRSGLVLVHALGVLLFACELGITSLMFSYDVERPLLAKLPHHRIVLGLIERLGERKPVWPFDLYPTFTPAVPPMVQVWEARWVLPSGREVRVSPRAYNNLFGSWNVTWNVTTLEMLRPARADQDEERSLKLAHLLWEHEEPSVKRRAMAVNIYRSDYKLQAPAGQFPAELAAQNRLYAFPLSPIK